ncbi:MAG: DUF393 domain-containing protein [Candidatus Marinimicrobia bacterium]|nr:DUF393 domain-containing protein [Candidatus Neomarinimicrobiota bacterium]
MNKLKSKLTLPWLTKVPQKPLLVFDGECGFCRRLASKWYEKTGEQIDFVPYNEISDNYRHTSIEEFKKEIKLIYPEGRVYGGAAAVFKVIEHTKSPLRALIWIYNHTRAFDPIWEWVYKIVARKRGWIRFVTRG